MHKAVIINITFFILLLSIILLHISCSRNQESWINYTNANCVITLVIEGNYIWAGTDGGVIKWNIDNGEYIKFTTADGLVDNIVQSIAIDSEGNKWFGTSGGVSKFDGKNWTTFTTDDGLAYNEAPFIVIDPEDNKWIGYGYYAKGVSKYDGTNWTTYTESDGLVDDRVLSIAVDSAGNKWFGTRAGLSFLGNPVTGFNRSLSP